MRTSAAFVFPARIVTHFCDGFVTTSTVLVDIMQPAGMVELNKHGLSSLV